MAFPETLTPLLPADGDLASAGAGQIRALKQFIADVFGLPVSPNAVTLAAFAISSGGVVTILRAGATVAADPTVALGIATKQYVDNIKGVAQTLTKTFTSAVVASSVNTTLAQQAVTLPALGVSYRVLVTYKIFAHGTTGAEAWISDGTDVFAHSSLPSGASGSISGQMMFLGAEPSKSTYAAGTSATFSLLARTYSSTLTMGDADVYTTSPSQMVLAIIPAA